VRSPTSRSDLWRAAAVLAVAGIVVGVGLLNGAQARLAHRVPRTYDLLSRLPGHPADPPEPSFGAPIDLAAIRKAAHLIPRGATYKVIVGDPENLGYAVNSAATLYLADALRVSKLADAAWVVSYDAHPPIPAALDPVAVTQLGADVLVIRTGRR
jgi:hypothetical protein